MTSDFLRAYSLLSIKIAHQRKILAMGGMAAQIPIKHGENITVSKNLYEIQLVFKTNLPMKQL